MRPSRRAILTSVLTLAFGAGGFAVVAPWIAKRAIAQVAANHGWQVQLGGGRVGLRGIALDKIQLDIASGPAQSTKISAIFNDTRVGWSALFGSRKFSAASGSISLTGEGEDLHALVRGQRRTPGGGRNLNSQLALDLAHLELQWRAQPSEEPSLLIHDLDLERNADHWSLRAANIRARYRGISVDVKGVSSQREAEASEPSEPFDQTTSKVTESGSTRTSASELVVQYDSTIAPPTAITATSSENAAAAAAASTARAIPSATRAAHSPSGSTSPSATTTANRHTDTAPSTHQPIRKTGTTVNAESGPKKEFLPTVRWLVDKVEQLRLSVDKSKDRPDQRPTWLSGLGVGSKFECPALRLRFVDDGQKLDLGPWPVTAERREQQVIVELSQQAGAGHSALSSKLVIEELLDRASLRTSVGPIALPQLGISDGDFGLENIQSTQLALEVGAEFVSKTGELSLESKGRLSGLSIRQPFLSRDTIKNMGFEWEGSATLDSTKREIRSEQLRISVGPVVARLKGAVELASTHHSIDGSLDIPLAACQDLFDVLPEGMTPLLRGWRVDRNFALRLTVAFDSRKPNKSTIGFRLDNQCRVLSVPAEVAPSKFERPFVLEVEDERGALQPMNFGPGTWGYAPLSAISAYVESAVLVFEDGRFLNHDGFDREAIQNSIRENLRTGRFARGGSTVSMQLAKNLYLRRDKTLARKLQEAALTMLLEQTFSKRELLELYLNVIEFGPGVYGIGAAAKHYFETTPDRLTMAQAFFLISLLPNPKVSHFGPDGLVHPGWMKFLRSLMVIAQRRGHFSTAELEIGLAEQPALHVPGTPPSATARRILQDPGAIIDEEPELPSADE